MAFIEREEHVGRLESLLDACVAGEGRFVLLDGALGTGKTALQRVLMRRAGERGFKVLGATCSPEDHTLPFAMLGQLVRDVEIPRETLGELKRSITSGRLEMRSDPIGARIVHHLSLRLLELSRDAPILVAIDDVRNADDFSLRFLRYAGERIADARVMIVITDDTEERSPYLSFHAELARQHHFCRIGLDLLSGSGVRRLLAERLGPAKAARLAPEFLALTGGSPLLLHALVEDLPDRPGGASAGYGRAVVSCLRRCEAVTARVARSLAVLGPETGVDDVRELAEADLEAFRRAISALSRAGLILDHRFRHTDGPSAALADLRPADLHDLYHRAASLSQRRGASATSVAELLLRAGRPHEPWAAGVLTEAAEQALLGGRPAAAAGFLRLACETGADDATRATSLPRLVDAEWQVDPSRAAQNLAPLVDALSRNVLEPRDGPALIQRLLWHGRFDEAAAALDFLRSPRPGSRIARGMKPLVREIEFWAGFAYPALTAGERRSNPPAQHGPFVAMAGIDAELRSAAALADGLASGRCHEMAESAERTLRSLEGRLDGPWGDEAALLAARVLVEAGRGDTVAARLDGLVELAGRRGRATAHARFTAAKAWTALTRGDLPTAMDHAQAALARLGTTAWGVAIGLPLSTAVLAATRKGEYENAARHLTFPVPGTMDGSLYGLEYLHARGHHLLATGRADAALADFLRCGELLRAWRIGTTGLVDWRASAAEAFLRLGHPAEGEALIEEELAQPGGPSGARGHALRLRATLSAPDERLSALAEALGIFKDLGDRFQMARVLTEMGRAHHALNDGRRAKILYRQALHLAQWSGARPLVRELKAVSGEATLPPAGDRLAPEADILSDSEHRVASLATLGQTNREIATRLRISPSTVEQHLTRVYRKLGVKRRKDLPAGLFMAVDSSLLVDEA